MEHVDVGGMRIAFRRRGTGPPLVLLHGGLCDGGYFDHLLGSFADTFTVVAWDAPGCGGSSVPPPWFRMSDYAACLGGFVGELDLPPAHVLGHSWGSSLALALCGQRPRAVRSLVLVGPYAGWAGSLPPDEVDARLRIALESGDPAVATMARAMAEADLRPVLGDIAVPTLVLAGDADVRSSPEVARRLHAAIPGSTLTRLPGLGHESVVESPETVAAEVRTFLASIG